MTSGARRSSFRCARAGLDRNLCARGDLFAFDDQVGLRFGAAVRVQAGCLFLILQGHAPGLCHGRRCRTGRGPCRRRRRHPCSRRAWSGPGAAQRRVWFHRPRHKLAAARLDGDLVAHRFPLRARLQCRRAKILIVGSGDVARRILSQLAACPHLRPVARCESGRPVACRRCDAGAGRPDDRFQPGASGRVWPIACCTWRRPGEAGSVIRAPATCWPP